MSGRRTYKALGSRRMRGTNPRSAGTDLRSRLEAPRQTAWPTNPRFLAAASVAASARYVPSPPLEGPAGTIHPHGPSRGLLGAPTEAYYDSEWRRRAAATSGPCAACDDNGWIDTPAGAIACTERITPGAAEYSD